MLLAQFSFVVKLLYGVEFDSGIGYFRIPGTRFYTGYPAAI